MIVFWRRLSPMISCGPLARAKFWFVRFLSVVKDRTSAQLAIEESKDSHLSVQHICSNIHKPVENCKRKKLSQIIAGFSTPPNIAPKLVLFGAPPFLSLLLLYSAFGSVSRSSPKITKTKKKILKIFFLSLPYTLPHFHHFSYHRHSFINPTNPKDYVCIKLGLGTSDPLVEQRAKLLEMMQIAKNTALQVLPPPKYISSELLAFVRVFNMNAQQLEHWITSERAMDLLHIDCALETTLESKTWQYLQTRLMLLLRVFPTTLEADEEQLAAHKKGELYLCYVEAMVLEYRVLEKRILAAALDYAKQRVKT